ncbi:MAG: alpha/beta hydrolase [Albidovulum sp.]
MADQAPFYDDVAKAPTGESCAWLTASDGVRLRAVHWRGGDKGTVLLFPGRTEYIEKYGNAAGEYTARGYSMAAIDWRGQGLADRLLEDRAPGHVTHFDDYQKDVAAFVAFATAEELPQPWFLVGHSMGGCIGLRAIYEGLPIRAATFSAPMWGIKMPIYMRPVAWGLSTLATVVGQGHRFVPSTSPMNYVLEAPFEGNVLTRDREMHAMMCHQLIEHPDLGIGGPTMQWLREALIETRALRQLASPAMPCLTVLGSEERIVNADAIHERMRRWPGSEFDLIGNAEHEMMMENPEIRKKFYDRSAALFDANLG